MLMDNFVSMNLQKNPTENTIVYRSHLNVNHIKKKPPAHSDARDYKMVSAIVLDSMLDSIVFR